MSTEGRELRVAGLAVAVVRKPIKNLHLGVYPPNGRVRVAAPLRVSDKALRLAVIEKLGWIRKQQARFAAQPRQPEREMVGGESHYYLGRRYRLRVVFSNGPPGIQPRGRTLLELRVRRGSSAAQRLQVLERWYRERLRELLPPLLLKWQPILGLQGVRWGIRKMKTKWGSCSVGTRRVWLNLELAKTPAVCLEYVAVHELAHLRERHHNDRFVALLDHHLPQWGLHRQTLNAAPLAHASWKY